MNQKTIMIALIAGIILLLGGIGLALNGGRTNKNASDSSSVTGSQAENISGMDMTKQKSQTEVAAQEANKVDIKDFKFLPSKITVKKGTTVTWTNQDSIRHDVTPLEMSNAFKGSELLGKGESYSYTFNSVGTYNYKCTPHPFMKGTVEVIE